MINVTYQKLGGITCADGEVEGVAAAIIATGRDVTVSSFLLINQIRILVKRGKWNCDNIIFLYENYKIRINEDGRLSHWPEGFCDIYDHILNELVDYWGE